MASRVAILLSLALFLSNEATEAYAQQQEAVRPDTLLILRNGAQVRGVFVEVRDGQYSLRLPDGRSMSYPTSDVERMERISGSESAPVGQVAPAQTAPFACRTFISEKDLDKSFYTFIQNIKAKKKWYGSSDVVYQKIAEKAREIGADAVINFHTWHSPSGWAWASPHGEGMAVKLTEAGRRALPRLEGQCY